MQPLVQVYLYVQMREKSAFVTVGRMKLAATSRTDANNITIIVRFAMLRYIIILSSFKVFALYTCTLPRSILLSFVSLGLFNHHHHLFLIARKTQADNHSFSVYYIEKGYSIDLVALHNLVSPV